MAEEAKLEEYFSLRIRKMGGMTEKIAPVRWGLPDRLVLLPGGHLYLVELKARGGAVRPAQSVWHAKAAKLGTKVVVLSGKTGIDTWLAHINRALEAKRIEEYRREQSEKATS